MNTPLPYLWELCAGEAQDLSVTCCQACMVLRDAGLVQAAGLWHCLCTLALVCFVGPRLEQLQFSRLGVLGGDGVALKGAELLKWAAGQNTSEMLP